MQGLNLRPLPRESIPDETLHFPYLSKSLLINSFRAIRGEGFSALFPIFLSNYYTKTIQYPTTALHAEVTKIDKSRGYMCFLLSRKRSETV